MPAKNTVKVYSENCFYHVYNRGVEKRVIFLDDQDYRVFLNLLKIFLSPPDLTNKFHHPLFDVTGFIPVRRREITSDLYKNIELVAYCLMPNHFHLLIKQIDNTSLSKLMKKLLTTYSMYFNRRYKRVGHLFQGIFKAIMIVEDNYLLHLSRYIHLNPIELTGMNPVNYRYSSYGYYLGLKSARWIKPKVILDYFYKNNNDITRDNAQVNTYKQFVEDYLYDSIATLGRYALDLD